jgi:multidrug efflux system outer membrane protein
MFKYRMPFKKFFPLLLAAQGCQLMAPYQAPQIASPETWKEQTCQNAPQEWKWKPEITKKSEEEAPQEASPQNESDCQSTEEVSTIEELPKPTPLCGKLEDWWTVFQDPSLNALEERAIESSYSLWAAVERVNQAKALARAQYAALFPSLSFNPGFSADDMLVRNPIPSNPASAMNSSSASSSVVPTPTPAAALPKFPSLFRFWQPQYILPFTASYEVDLWNGLSNNYLSAKYQAQAAYEAYRTVLLTLTTNIASTYFQIRGLDAEQEILQKNIALLQEAYDINLSRFQAGLVQYVDVSRALAELASVQADSADVFRQRALQENILVLLVGEAASDFHLDPYPLRGSPPCIPPTAPLELLARRPDVAQAERTVAANYATIGVAYAAFYPSLNLTGTLGLESPKWTSLFKWKARLWSYAINTMFTVFDAGYNQANLCFAKASYEEAIANYEQQVLIAFKDVEDALANLHWENVQLQDLDIAVKASIETVSLSTLRYNQGLSNYLDVVDAERTALSTERNAMRVQTARYLSTLGLIKALGGGWAWTEEISTPSCEL